MKYILILMSMLAISFSANADDNMKTQASKHSFNDTLAKLEAVLKEKGLTVFAKIDHADGALKAGLKMLLQECVARHQPRAQPFGPARWCSRPTRVARGVEYIPRRHWPVPW